MNGKQQDVVCNAVRSATIVKKGEQFVRIPTGPVGPVGFASLWESIKTTQK